VGDLFSSSKLQPGVKGIYFPIVVLDTMGVLMVFLSVYCFFTAVAIFLLGRWLHVIWCPFLPPSIQISTSSCSTVSLVGLNLITLLWWILLLAGGLLLKILYPASIGCC